MIKLFISPTYEGPDKADGGIRRVVENMVRHFPKFGIEVVDSVDKADVVNYHAANYAPHPGKPLLASCHGLYWTDYDWPDPGFYNVNRAVAEVMARADAVTVPSNWVGKAVARGMMVKPQTIYHGVNPQEWEVSGNRGPQNYVLWNKARSDVVSNAQHLIEIAANMTDTLFWSTVGVQSRNLEVIGVKPYHEMKPIIAGAGVYLCTARETFGIGTLEAMAAGVPIAGWKFGGQEEIVKQGVTGYLAPYGDYDALSECIRLCFKHRTKLSQNCINDVTNRWQWADKIEQYANIIKRLHYENTRIRPQTSIIVPCHNLGKYLPIALDSVKAQTVDDWECIIVDDASTDNTAETAENYANDDKRFKLVSTGQNIGLCQARNIGTEISDGRYINFLDADDLLRNDAIETLENHLNDNPATHIAYGRLDLIDNAGQKTKEGGAVTDYNFYDQLAHLHQFPIGASLFRRRVLENSGGFKIRDWRAEDAAFIARVTSFGFRASKATDEALLYYRVRSDSKSMMESKKANGKNVDGDWTSWLGWRVGARTAPEGRNLRGNGHMTPPELTPYGAQATPGERPFNTGHYQEPLVSIIIPVGPAHAHLSVDAIDSLLAQTIANWECIVINDTGEPLNVPHWVTLIDTKGKEGAGKARNLGIKAARGDLILFLDADDWLLSNCLDTMITAYGDMEGSKYIYTDYLALDNDGNVKHEKMKPYDQSEWKGQHAVNILIDKKWLLDVGLFDENMGGWEDWDLPLKLAINGYCGFHVNTPCFVYRKFAGKRREWAFDNGSSLLEVLKQRYADYYNEVKMKKKCCGGNNNAAALVKLQNTLAGRTTVQSVTEVNSVKSTRMEFTGQQTGAITFIRVGGKQLQKTYKGSANPTNRYINAHPQDVALLESTGKWRKVSRPITTAATGRPVGVNIDPSPRPTPPPAKVESPPVYEPPAIKDILMTDKARAILDTAGINPAYVTGTGKDGKITVMDARTAVKELTP